MPSDREGKWRKRGGMRTVTCGSSRPKPSSYSVSSASSEHSCRISDTLLCKDKRSNGKPVCLYGEFILPNKEYVHLDVQVEEERQLEAMLWPKFSDGRHSLRRGVL